MIKKEMLIGLDLGQQNDYTVLCCLEVIPNIYQKKRTIYNLTYLYRVPLETAYPRIVNWISDLVHTQLLKYNCVLVVDYTGVGRPVVDLLREQQITLLAANITSGYAANWRLGNEVSIPKKEIITSLLVTLSDYRLRISPHIFSVDTLTQEFVGFNEKISARGNLQYEAGYGYHDDIVISIGLAVWYGEHRTRQMRTSRAISGD